MTQLTQQVLDKGYQYYDWNVSSGDGGTVTADQIIAQSETDEYTKVMLLFHDTEAKESTIQALPTVMEYYKIWDILLRQSIGKAWLCIIQ